ncbi:TPA: hypothetical protein R4S27_005499 [Citrobacter freundii]|nr:hypothetical protein [Citrobacter freundii]
MHNISVEIPAALGVHPPSGADVVLIDDLNNALAGAGLPQLKIEPITWTPPSGRPVIYRSEVPDILRIAGINPDTSDIVKTFCSGPLPIDDNELDALLEMRERDGHSESFRIALCGALDAILIRLYSAERQLR